MSLRLLLSVALLPLASAFSAAPLVARGRRSATAVKMFEDPDSSKKADITINSITRSSTTYTERQGSIIVTDDSGSFYESRTAFQMLHDFGRYAKIVACSDSTAEAKKMLISRTSRYSGMLDVLEFYEGDAAGAFTGAEQWLAIHPDEDTLGPRIDAAVAAGVSRIFVLLAAALDDATTLEAKLAASGVAYTVMRTGPLVSAPGGSGLKLSDVSLPVCDEVPKEDVFRFVAEALTLTEAHGRSFSLCPAPGVESYLKQMRLCGYERREEVQLLLAGKIKDEESAALEPTAEEAAEEAELVLRSEAEVEAERAEELSALLERARQRGIENQKRLAFEEKERVAKREEMSKYYSTPDPDGAAGGADDAAPKDADADDKPEA